MVVARLPSAAGVSRRLANRSWARGRCDTCVYTPEVTVTRKAVHARRLSPQQGRASQAIGACPSGSEPAMHSTRMGSWAHTARGAPFCVLHVRRRRSLSCCFSVAWCLRSLECMSLSAGGDVR